MNAQHGFQQQVPDKVLQAYGLAGNATRVQALTSGLINTTFKVTTPHGTYVLQKINTTVFTNSGAIHQNLEVLEQYLKATGSSYNLIVPVMLNGTKILHLEGSVYRVFNFVPGSVTLNTVANATQAYHAALQFGTFTAQFAGLPISALQETLPGFHDLSLRYNQFQQSLVNASPQRTQAACLLIAAAQDNSQIVATYQDIISRNLLPQRVIHHDTKISNILFNTANEGLCVIDLDTVMPGFIISDLGDMMRTYLCPLPEDTAEPEKIFVSYSFFNAIASGYAEAMGKFLTRNEWAFFAWSGKYIIYMQALRFLTDYLNGDTYYHISYTGQNLRRATAQFALLNAYQARMSLFSHTVAGLAKKYGHSI